MTDPEPTDRRRWSITWIFRVQRGQEPRDEPSRIATDRDGIPQPSAFWKAVPWIIMLALGIEIAIGVWLDLLPR